MGRKLMALGAALILGVATTACASTQERPQRTGDAMIQVENNNSLLVSVEAVADGVDYNLGQVETAQSETFEIPRPAKNTLDLRVRIDPVGSPATYLSDEIIYSPGDLIHVEVESNLNLTTVTIQ